MSTSENYEKKIASLKRQLENQKARNAEIRLLYRETAEEMRSNRVSGEVASDLLAAIQEMELLARSFDTVQSKTIMAITRSAINRAVSKGCR